MTDEERRIITAFVERISGVQQQQQGGGLGASPWGGSVPSTQPSQRPPLPPVDPEADRLVADLFNRYPEARYRITQTAFVQEAALLQAQNRIQELEWELENARRQGQYAQAQAAQQNRGGGGFLGGMFGGGGARQAVAPPPPMPPRPQPLAPPPGMASPQMLQQAAGPGRSGPGFLGTALTTAAGVAGGLVLGNALVGMLSGGAHASALGGLGSAAQGAGDAAAGAFAQEQVAAGASPWTDPGQAAGGWGGEKTPYQEPDAQPAGYDDAGYDSAQDDASYGGYDDGGGGDEEI